MAFPVIGFAKIFGGIGGFIGRFWREFIILGLIVTMFIGAGIFTNRIEKVNTSLTAMTEKVGGLNEKVGSLREDNKTYKETLTNIQRITEKLSNNVGLSQADINKLMRQQQVIVSKVNSIDLTKLSCEGKFDWMIEQGNETKKSGVLK